MAKNKSKQAEEPIEVIAEIPAQIVEPVQVDKIVEPEGHFRALRNLRVNGKIVRVGSFIPNYLLDDKVKTHLLKKGLIA